MDDKAVRKIIIEELEFEPSIDGAHIGVAIEDGVVTLSGHVGSYMEKVTAERAVLRIKGVRAVADEIEVRYPDDRKTADDQIAKRALDLLAWDARLPDGAVKVNVEKGWVTLTGAVAWYYQREAAQSAVHRLSGVVGVTNRIAVKPHASSPDVREKILAALKRKAELQADSVHISVKGDKVTLEGSVKTWSERNLVESAAWSAPGVGAVEDKLRVA